MFLTKWQLKDFDVGAGLGAGVNAGIVGDGWTAVDAPGDVYQALHSAGRLPDPLGDRNEEACAWVSEREWWWVCQFDPQAASTPVERLQLVLHGLDTYAGIWLNGQLVGRSDNMFLAVEFDVTALLRADAPNTLAIRFDPISVHVGEKTAPNWPGVSLGEAKRQLVRKAQFGWGWDWGPRLPTVGIWRPVELRRQRVALIDDLFLRTLELREGLARLSIGVEVADFAGARNPRVDLTLADPQGRQVAQTTLLPTASEGRGSATWDLDLSDPQLWWTRALGTQPLYRLSAQLRDDRGELDRRELKTGIRTIELDTSPDPEEPGTDFFRFKLNGRPIFSKGACWIPAHSLVGILNESHYGPLLQSAVEGNMNMLRVWGGGLYEHDAFYDLCDELGLLVWQDFMFACALYPEDAAMAASVEAEARYQVRRLRHHPSLAVWCGNNENQMLNDYIGNYVGMKLPLPGDLYYEKVLPAVVSELDPTTPYWPGSPYGGVHANSQRKGDVHDWTVWHGGPPVPDDKAIGKTDLSAAGVAYQRYAEDMGRFISEFGIHSAPVKTTLQRSVPEDQLYFRSPGLENRNKDNPKNKIDPLMEPLTGLPQNLDEYIDFTMMTQAEGLKFGIEHFRRRMPHCSGTLIWQLNDCWPSISWSVLDFYGFPKASFFYVERAYAPLLASFKPMEDGAFELWLTSDLVGDVTGELVLELLDLREGQVWKRNISYQVADNSSRSVARINADEIQAGPSRVLRVSSPVGMFPTNRHFFAAIKELPRDREARPQYRIESQGPNKLKVTLEAMAYLYFVQMLTPFETTQYSDNYFDMAAGERRIVTLTDSSRTLRPEDVTVRCG